MNMGLPKVEHTHNSIFAGNTFYSTAKASVYATLPRFFNGTGHRITGNRIDKLGADGILLLQHGAPMVCDNLEANRTDDTAYMPKIALGLVWYPHYIILQAFERALQDIPRDC
jgi:hypothetical protein